MILHFNLKRKLRASDRCRWNKLQVKLLNREADARQTSAKITGKFETHQMPRNDKHTY